MSNNIKRLQGILSENNAKAEITDIILKSADLKPLEAQIEKMLNGKGHVKGKIKLVTGYGSPGFTLDLSHADWGMFKNCYKHVAITTTNSDIDPKGIWWAIVGLRYELNDGGSNGINLFTLWYELEGNKWTFREAGR